MTRRFSPLCTCANATPAAAGRPKPKPPEAQVKNDFGRVVNRYCFKMPTFDGDSSTRMASALLTCASVENRKSGVMGVVATGCAGRGFSGREVLVVSRWMASANREQAIPGRQADH